MGRLGGWAEGRDEQEKAKSRPPRFPRPGRGKRQPKAWATPTLPAHLGYATRRAERPKILSEERQHLVPLAPCARRFECERNVALTADWDS